MALSYYMVPSSQYYLGSLSFYLSFMIYVYDVPWSFHA